MHYFELTCKAYLKKDIDFKNSFEIISKYISFAISQSDEFKKLHQKNSFKFYTFGSFFPLESDKVYKNGKIYEFRFRTINEELANFLQTALRENINNPYLLVLQATKKTIKQFFITEIYTITPTVITTENSRFWTIEEDGDILKLQKQLHDNLEKKYQSFYGKKIEPQQNFIQLLELKNQKPQTILLHNKKGEKIKPYKLFGNKFKIIPNEDEISQKLAFIALGAGLGEKNSFGGGFCLGRGMR